jgi:hypothetical protein
MRFPTVYSSSQPRSLGDVGRFMEGGVQMPRQLVIGIILIFALFAFELFNFDTTRFALHSLLGDVSFLGIGWATILAIAFCSIDFAGLARLFTPERGREEPKEVWYLMGAWLLGATMNAVMTWWAVSLTLLNHDLGNEVLSREQLLKVVPFFVAILVWLTRILFIGAVTMAGERLLESRAMEMLPADKPVSPYDPKTRSEALQVPVKAGPEMRPDKSHPPGVTGLNRSTWPHLPDRQSTPTGGPTAGSASARLDRLRLPAALTRPAAATLAKSRP